MNCERFLQSAMLALCIFMAAAQASGQQAGSAIPGEVLVQMVPGATADQLKKEIQLHNANLNPVIKNLGGSYQIFKIQFETSQGSSAVLARQLATAEFIVHAQENHYLAQRKVPSDPSFGLQWNLDNDGTGGIADADIDAPEAWDISTGGLTALGDSIVIAVVDDGFDLNHEDLWFWKNRAEIPDNGIDDDGNGYVDDYTGWNATDSINTLPVMSHGTHVSGIAAALGDNSIGIVGVNWNTAVLPVFCDVEEDDVVAAYIYIAEMRRLYNETNGAKGAYVVVTNSSFGIDFAQPEDYPIWCGLYDQLGELGILNPAATINSYQNIDVIGDVPTACESPFMVAVTNTNISDEINGAGYGETTIDLGAPGTQVYSTTPGNNYGFNTGTSMATPHVAGTIALMYSAACEQFMIDYEYDPAGMSLLVKDYLLNSVDDIADLSGKAVSEGRLNIFHAVELLREDYCAATGLEEPALNAFKLYPNPAEGLVTIQFETAPEGALNVLNQVGQVVYSQRISSAQIQLELSALPAGLYQVIAGNQVQTLVLH